MRCDIILCPWLSLPQRNVKKLLRGGEIEVVLHRLDRLTQDEARMTVAQALSVVYGLVRDVKIVMEGVERLHVCSDILLSTCSIRWKVVNRWYSTGLGYVSHHSKQESSVLN